MLRLIRPRHSIFLASAVVAGSVLSACGLSAQTIHAPPDDPGCIGVPASLREHSRSDSGYADARCKALAIIRALAGRHFVLVRTIAPSAPRSNAPCVGFSVPVAAPTTRPTEPEPAETILITPEKPAANQIHISPIVSAARPK